MMAIKELRAGIPTITGILCLMMFFAIEVSTEAISISQRLISQASAKESQLCNATSTCRKTDDVRH